MLLSTNISGAFILIASGSLFTILIFFLLLFIQYVRKKVDHAKQIEHIKSVYEQTLLQSQLEIQEQTLRSISHEIHDNIGQILSLVSLNLNTISINEQDKLNSTDELVQKAITDLRSLSKSLNPERVQQIGLHEALLNDLQYIEQTGKYKTSLFMSDDFPEFTPDRTIIVYRIMQEIMNNIIKHAKAKSLNISLHRQDGTAIVTIADDGIGFNIESQKLKGLGLNTIQYRAAVLNATLHIKSEENKGTIVSLIFNSL